MQPKEQYIHSKTTSSVDWRLPMVTGPCNSGTHSQSRHVSPSTLSTPQEKIPPNWHTIHSTEKDTMGMCFQWCPQKPILSSTLIPTDGPHGAPAASMPGIATRHLTTTDAANFIFQRRMHTEPPALSIYSLSTASSPSSPPLNTLRGCEKSWLTP